MEYYSNCREHFRILMKHWKDQKAITHSLDSIIQILSVTLLWYGVIAHSTDRIFSRLATRWKPRVRL